MIFQLLVLALDNLADSIAVRLQFKKLRNFNQKIKNSVAASDAFSIFRRYQNFNKGGCKNYSSTRRINKRSRGN